MQEANEEQKHEKDRSHLITEHSKSGREWMHLCKQLLSSSFLTLRNFETPLCGSRIVTILMNTPRTGNVSRSEAPRKRELLRALLFLARPLLLSLLGVNPFAYIQRSTQMEMAAQDITQERLISSNLVLLLSQLPSLPYFHYPTVPPLLSI